MYKQISIKNLKVFKDEQKLKIAPITLLYGENSSGKTSLLKTFDIVHNIFSENQVKRGKNVGQKDSPFYRNENIQNISAKNIHFYSNQFNKKNINISILLDVITNNENIKNVVSNSQNRAALTKKEGELYGVKFPYYAIKPGGYITLPLNVNLKIKYFPKKEINKVTEIEIQNNDGKSLISFSRINKDYKILKDFFDENQVGYLSPNFFRNMRRPDKYASVYHRGRPIPEEDYFVDEALYADYKINIKEKLIWQNIYINYNKIFSENKEIKLRYKKIKIISKALFDFNNWKLKSKKNFSTEIEYKPFAYYVAKNVLSGVIPKIFTSDYKIKNHNFKPRFSSMEDFINSLNNKGVSEEIRKIFLKDQKKFNMLTSVGLAGLPENKIKCPKCGTRYEIDVSLIPKTGRNLQCSFCKNTWSFKGKWIKKIKYDEEDKLFLREFLLASKISNTENINNILLKRIIEKKENFLKFQSSAKLDQKLFNIRFFKKSANIRYEIIRENGKLSETTFDVVSLFSDYICNDLDNLFYEYSVTKGFDIPAFKSDSATNILRSCIAEIRKTVDSFIICHPSKTNIDWHVARKTDFPKGVLEKIRKAKAEEKKEDVFRGRSILSDQDEEIRKKYLTRKSLIKGLDDFDPAKISSDGRNFHTTIINNDKLRIKLNKTLKNLLGLEIKVLTPKFLKEFLKSKEKYNMLRNAQRSGLMYPVGMGRYTRTKYILIRDLKFKKSFEIHGEEIGKGPSNILPFIAQILSEKPSLTYIIQELENNWHPKYQAAIMEFVANNMKDSQKEWGNYMNKNFILETHSELFVLQLKKLVQKGILKPEDVSINFVKRTQEGNSIIHNIPLNTQGGFEKPWPGGFFTERMEVLTS